MLSCEVVGSRNRFSTAKSGINYFTAIENALLQRRAFLILSGQFPSVLQE